MSKHATACAASKTSGALDDLNHGLDAEPLRKTCQETLIT